MPVDAALPASVAFVASLVCERRRGAIHGGVGKKKEAEARRNRRLQRRYTQISYPSRILDLWFLGWPNGSCRRKELAAVSFRSKAKGR